MYSSTPSFANYERVFAGQGEVSYMGAAPLLEIENLSTHYVSARGTRVVRAVEGVTLSINARETLGIVGESGCGKSTLARLLMHLIPRDAGELIFDGEGVEEAR